MLYHFLATDQNGRVTEGDVDAQNLAGVLQHLAGKDLRPVSIKPVKLRGGSPQAFFGGINLRDKVFITKYLSLMLRVGTDLLSAINILISDFEKPAVKNFLLEVRETLTQGRPFYEAFAKYPTVFSGVFTSLVKAAETSGNLQETFDRLSESLQKEADLNGRIRGALIYPIILLSVAGVVTIFLVTFAIPRIADVFVDAGIKPPAFSRIVFAIGLFANDHIMAIIGTVIVGTVAGFYFFFRNPVGRKIGDQIMSNMPLVRDVYREYAIQRFAGTFASLMKAGLPIIQTCRITADVVGSNQIRVALIRIADEGLSRGLTIGDSFRRELAFPRVVTNLMAISEKAGHVDEILETLAVFYANSVDEKVRSLVAVLEPVLLIFMGLLVGVISLSIIIPIYQLTSQF